MEELIKKAQKGDKEAFSEVILSMKNDLYKIAKLHTSNDDDIEDLIQETMIEVYKSIKKLKDLKKLKTWTISILINKCKKAYKKANKNIVSIEELNLDEYIFQNRKEIDDDLNFRYLIKDLKYEERLILILYYMEEYTTDEIAKILHINNNTVRTNLHRARQTIKNNLEKEGV